MTVKCSKCGFEAPFSEWRTIEDLGATKVPEETIKEYEEYVDTKEDIPPLVKWFAKTFFRALGQSGTMPYHSTNFVCPQCGNRFDGQDANV